MIEPASFASIHITTDGKTITAVRKEVGKVTKRAKATCTPGDAFDFETGARVAFDRLCTALAEGSRPQPEKKQPEPIRLHCFKSYSSSFLKERMLTAGKSYEINTNGRITLDDGESYGTYKSFADFGKGNPDYAKCLVPEVKHPARVGEWVKIVNSEAYFCGDTYKNGDIFKIVSLNNPCRGFPKGENMNGWLIPDEYVVLDGYQPPKEPEKPKCWSGKVVCVHSATDCFVAGKVYSFNDGITTNSEGGESPYNYDFVKSIEQMNSIFKDAKFIEFKGE